MHATAQTGSVICFEAIDGIIAPNKAVVDSKGNLYTVGEFERRVDFDPGPGKFIAETRSDNDLFLLKLSPEGAFVWVKTLGADYMDKGLDVAIDSEDNIYITGSIYGTVDLDPGPEQKWYSAKGSFDAFISKFNSEGDLLWVHAFGSSDWDEGRSIVIDGDDNIYLAGCFYGTIDIDPGLNVYNLTSTGSMDLFLIKLSKNGDLIWGHSFGGISREDYQVAITIDNNGDLLMTGAFVDWVDFDPGEGRHMLNGRGVHHMFLLKLSKDGDFIWVKQIGSIYSGDTYPWGVAVDKWNNIFITGDFSSAVDFDPGEGKVVKTALDGSDIFLLKLDETGDFQWVEHLSGDRYNYSYSVAVDNEQNIFITGQFHTDLSYTSVDRETKMVSTDEYKELFVAKVRNEGGVESFTYFVSYTQDKGTSVYVNPNNGNIVLTGWLQGKGSLMEYWDNNLKSDQYFVGAIFSLSPDWVSGIWNQGDRNRLFHIGPNPVYNRLWIEIEQEGSYTVQLRDMMGALVKEAMSIDRSTELDLSGIAPGIYFASLWQNGKQETRRIVKAQ